MADCVGKAWNATLGCKISTVYAAGCTRRPCSTTLAPMSWPAAPWPRCRAPRPAAHPS